MSLSGVRLMPVYLFTWHAYRSWNADHPRAYVRPGQGILPPDPEVARHYDQHASQPPVRFDALHQEVLVWITYDACQRRSWRLHHIATDLTHVHILVSWQHDVAWEEVRDRLKNVASLMLGKKLSQPGRHWFVRKGSRKRVRDRSHFDHLVTRYLPSHRGLKWCEGSPPPPEPEARSS